jgi:hypothetical protein
MHSMVLSTRRLSYLRSLSLSLHQKPVLQNVSSLYYNRVSFFSSSETARKILSVEDVKKMLVVDLKNELRSRGSAVSGKKADLQQRLFEILNSEQAGISVPLKDVQVEKEPVEMQPHSKHDILENPTGVVTGNNVETVRTVSSNSEFANHFSELETALNDKNYLKFEEAMLAMETMVRSVVPTTNLSSDEVHLLATKLRVWTEMESIPSESIASVLKSAGYLRVTVKPLDERRAVVKGIIEKYLQANNKSTRSIAIFFTALRKVGLSSKQLSTAELTQRILPLITTLVESKDLDIRSYSECLMALAKLELKWENFPPEAKREYLNRLNEMKPMMDIPSLDVLVRAFTCMLSFTESLDRKTFLKIICDLSIQGLKLLATGTPQEKQVSNEE